MAPRARGPAGELRQGVGRRDRLDLGRIADYLASISRDIPWHVTAFHPAYRMEGPLATPPATLVRAAGIGRQAGLHYVYAGNLPGQVGDLENTRCPQCLRLLVERRGHRIVRNELNAAGTCPACRTPIPGRWSPVHPVA